MKDNEIYMDNMDLKRRGWTDALIKRFLNAPDHWESVSHWANHTGKKVFSYIRVHLVEESQEFKDAFEKSIKRRKSNENTVKSFLQSRKTTLSNFTKWQNSKSNKDIKTYKIEKSGLGFRKLS